MPYPSKKIHQNPFTTFSVIQQNPDRHQNLPPWPLGHALPLQGISSKSIDNFFSYPIDTDKQTEVKT